MVISRTFTRSVLVISLLSVLVWILPLDTVLPRTTQSNKDLIPVVFRYDDYSSVSPTQMDLLIIDAFQTQKVPLTIGVIPFVCSGDCHDSSSQEVIPLTQDKAAILRDLSGKGEAEVALHGYSHQTLPRVKEYTEFRGLDYDSQCKRISEGKSLLEEMVGTRVTTFIPPWNSFDMNTAKALEALDLNCISPDARANSDEISKAIPSIKALPATCSITQVRTAVESARRMPKGEPIVVLFHQYEFLEVNGYSGRFSLGQLASLLEWVAHQEDIRTVTVSQAANMIDDLSFDRLTHNVSFNNRLRLVPSVLERGFLIPVGVYLTSNSIDNAGARIWVCIALLFFFVLAGSTVLLRGSVPSLRNEILRITCICGAMTILFLVLLSNFDIFNDYADIMVVAVILGALVAQAETHLAKHGAKRIKKADHR